MRPKLPTALFSTLSVVAVLNPASIDADAVVDWNATAYRITIPQHT